MKFRLQLSAFLVGASLIVTFSSPGVAQMFVGMLPPYQILAIVRSVGLVPTERPVRSGPTYFVRALDYSGRLVRVVIDGRSGGVLSVQAAGEGGPVRLGYYPRIRVPPEMFDDSDDGGVPNPSSPPPGSFGRVAPAWSPDPRVGAGSMWMQPAMPAPAARLPGGSTLVPTAPTGGHTADLAPAFTPIPRARPSAALAQPRPVAADPSQKLEVSPSHEVALPDQKPTEQTTRSNPTKPDGGSVSAFPPVTPLE